MLATVSFVLGVLLATIALAVTRRIGPSPKPTILSWCTLAFGLIAVTALAIAALLPSSGSNSGLGLNLISIAFGFAAMVAGVGSLLRRHRHWPTWVGLVAGLIPAVFWIVFAAGNLLSFGE